MKKVLAIVLVIALVFSMCGCGKSNGPEATVKGFCDSIRSFDLNAMSNYVKGGLGIEDIDMSGVPEAFMNILKSWAKELKYKIGKVETNGDKAQATVDFTYVDSSPVIKAALADYLGKAFAAAMSGDTSEDAMTKLFLECIESAKKSEKTTTKDATLTFDLEQADGKWVISDAPTELSSIVFSNMMDSLGGLFQ